ncbi:MAG: hypothetical protein ACAF41_27975 [Leptolyngbya sp. BL-A-14]
MTVPLSGSLPPVLPKDFPQGVSGPRYAIGDRVRFVPIPAEDYGIITGLQFAPAEHLRNWAWRYVVWLDDQSPSRKWTSSDLAWEDDLQLLAPAPVDVLTQEQTA